MKWYQLGDNHFWRGSSVRPVKPINLLKSIYGPSSAATTENPGLVPQRGPNYTLIVLLWQIHCLQLQMKILWDCSQVPRKKKIVKNMIAQRNCCKWEPCKICALHKICVCLRPWVKQPLHWYHGKNESWDWYRGLRPVSTLCSNTGNKDLAWLVWPEAIPALYGHQPSRDLNWYQLCTSFIQVSIPGILPASYQPNFGL